MLRAAGSLTWARSAARSRPRCSSAGWLATLPLGIDTLKIRRTSDLTAAEKAVLDRAILATYTRAGITTDPRTWQRTPPTLTDLATVLAEDGSEAAADLANRLTPFTTGSHARLLFNGHSTASTTGHLVVFALRQLPEEVKAPAMLLALDAIWRQVAHRTAPGRHLVVVDEAWILMRDGAGAGFLFRMAKAARKRWTGLALVTQDADDVLASPLGRAIVSNGHPDPAAPSSASHRGDQRQLSSLSW